MSARKQCGCEHCHRCHNRTGSGCRIPCLVAVAFDSLPTGEIDLTGSHYWHSCGHVWPVSLARLVGFERLIQANLDVFVGSRREVALVPRTLIPRVDCRTAPSFSVESWIFWR